MSKRRFRLLTMFVALLALGAVAVAAGGSTPAVKGLGKGKATAKLPVDLATFNASRWIVQLRGAPLATYGLGVGRYNGANNASGAPERPLLEQRGVRQPAQEPAGRVHQAARAHGTRREGAAQLPGRPQRPRREDEPQAGGDRPADEGREGRHAGHAVQAEHVRDAGADRRAHALGPARRPGQRRRGRQSRRDRQRHLRSLRRPGSLHRQPVLRRLELRRAPKGYPKGDKKFTNKKVLVARLYFAARRPAHRGQQHADPGPGREPARHARVRDDRVQREHERSRSRACRSRSAASRRTRTS